MAREVFLLNNMKGQTLIEVLIALGILSLVVTGIATVVTSGLSNTQFSKDQNTATKYAQEALEITRNIRNKNYTEFSSFNGIYCLPKGADTLGSVQSACSLPNVDNFIRSVQIEQSPGCGVNVSKITVVVSWQDGKCGNNSYCHKSQLVSCLSRVNPITEP